jgi:hypothetical protein
MKVEFDVALEFYEKLESKFRYPSIDPRLIRLESKLRPQSSPFFFLYRNSSEFYFYASVLNPIVVTRFFDLETPISYGGPVTNISDISKLEQAIVAFKDVCLNQNVEYYSSINKNLSFFENGITFKIVSLKDYKCLYSYLL